MTDLTKLADELRAAAYKAPDRATSRAMFEAAHIIRSAASLDITGFMAMHDAAAEARRVLVSGGNVPQAEADRSRLSRAALESALRLALAARDDDVFTALDMSPDTFRTEGGAVNVGKLRAAIRHPADYLPPDHWLAAAAPKGTT